MRRASVEDVKTPFSAKLFSFLRELGNNNDREWFSENKPRYERDVLFAAMDFVKQMQPRLAMHSRYLLADPKRVGVSRFKLDGASLKTAPRGIDPNHSAIEDLRRKSFAGVTTLTEKAFLQADVCDQIMNAFDDAKPLMKFLCDALQQPY